MVAERGFSPPQQCTSERIPKHVVDVLIPLIMEEIVKAVKAVPLERISERICERIADVYVSQIVEQVTEVPKTSNCDRTSQRAVEQIFDVLVPEMVNQLVEAPKTVPQDRIRQRTVEQIVDAPVPQVVEELAESFKVFSQDRIQQRAVEQIIGIPAVSLNEKIIEVPVARTPEKTQQGANTHVQRVIDTVEVEKPEIIELTVQRKFIIQEKINQETKPVERPQAQFSDKAGDMPVVVQRQVSTDQTVEKAMEVPPLQFTDKVMNIPVVAQRQIPVMVQTFQKTTEIPQLQCADQVVDVPLAFVVVVPHVQVVAETAETPQSQCIGEMVDVPAEVAVQAPHAHAVEKTVESPQLQIVKETAKIPETQMIQGTQTSESLGKAPVSENLLVRSINRVVDVPVMAQRPGPSRKKELEEVHRTVEVPRVIPQERILKPAGEKASVRERVRQFERNGGASCSNNVEVPRVVPGDRQSEEAEDEAPSKRRKQESDIEPRIPVHFSLCEGSSEQEAKSVDDSAELETRVRGECEEVPVARLADILSEMRDVKAELLQVRELVGVLVRRERHAEVKTEVAARRLDRMEREKDDADDAEREADLQEALTDQSKVVKLIVDKWFVDKGFGSGRTTTGEVVFIHASVVQDAEVLMVGTDAWAQVVNDDARAQGGYRARRAWGQDAWQAEKNKEIANKVAQQVRRAAALTAELAAQSEKKTAAVCDQPPGLDELAGHIEAPNMGAGGSHPQATMMPDPWATFKSPSASQATVISPLPASQSFSNFSGKSRKGRSRSGTRAQDNVAMLEETVRLVVEATGRDEASARQQLVNKRPAELLRARDFWRTRVEDKQRFQTKKKEAWEFFRRVPSFKPKSQEEFEEEFIRRVMTGYSSGSTEGREKYLDEWMIELQKKALERDSRLEAKERVKMGEEDAGSKRRTEWERIFERSPFLIAAS